MNGASISRKDEQDKMNKTSLVVVDVEKKDVYDDISGDNTNTVAKEDIGHSFPILTKKGYAVRCIILR